MLSSLSNNGFSTDRPKISKGLKTHPTPTSQTLPRVTPSATGGMLPYRMSPDLPGSPNNTHAAKAKLIGRPQDRSQDPNRKPLFFYHFRLPAIVPKNE